MRSLRKGSGLCALLLALGCANVSEVRQLEEIASLKVLEAPAGSFLIVDDGGPVPLGGDPQTLYQVPPGSHRVRILRGDEVLVDRRLFVTRGQVVELRAR